MGIDWTQIIVAFLTVGGFTTLFTINEKKTSMFLENANRINDAWKELHEESKENVRKLEEQVTQTLSDKGELARINSSLHHKLDDAHTEEAVAKLMYCDKTNCSYRNPPFGCNAQMIVASIKNDKNEKTKIEAQ